MDISNTPILMVACFVMCLAFLIPIIVGQSQSYALGIGSFATGITGIGIDGLEKSITPFSTYVVLGAIPVLSCLIVFGLWLMLDADQ